MGGSATRHNRSDESKMGFFQKSERITPGRTS